MSGFGLRFPLAPGSLLALHRSRRLIARHLPLLRPDRKYGPPGDRLLLVPQNLSTCDPSFVSELLEGEVSLANVTVSCGETNPLDMVVPHTEWREKLLGFSWLRHVRMADDAEGNRRAREIALHFIRRHQRDRDVAWQPRIASRRLISWLTNAQVLLEGLPARDYEAVLAELNHTARHLANLLPETDDGSVKLRSLLAICLAGLSIADQEALLDAHEPLLVRELDRQFLADGGHISRNPGAAVDILLDLLPLRHCVGVRERAFPEAMGKVVERALSMLRYMRLGDGMLARFNGMGETRTDLLATVLAYDENVASARTDAPDTGYVRLQRRATILVMDGGPPPPEPLAGDAHAGALSFELSVGTIPVIVNCGAPGPGQSAWRAASRSTAAHSTLTINDVSSGRLVQGQPGRGQSPRAAVVGPDRVEAKIGYTEDGSAIVRAMHDGYVERFGIIHERTLRLLPLGDGLHGVDRLRIGQGLMTVGRAGGVSFAIHFHVHPDVQIERPSGEAPLLLDLENGERWRFVASGARVSLEESVFLASHSGPYRSLQIVLRARLNDQATVHWRLERHDATIGDAREARRRRFAVIEGNRGDS
ncbi:MAG: heparinase [Rhizobiales bacterium]|nr:heparinase [Hyphomicrobiales bacterium]